MPAKHERLPVKVESFSYEDRHVLLARLSVVLAESGCWLTGCRILRPSEIEYRLDVQLRSAIEVYGGLIDAGLELTDGSHSGLTGLCVLCKNHRTLADLDRVVDLRLVVRLLDAQSQEQPAAMGRVG